MVFYKGALLWETLQDMPVDGLYDLNEQAKRINDERKREAQNNGL
jgi:hypothetical protein